MQSPLISATRLLDKIEQPDLKIFDVRGAWSDSNVNALKEYQNSHIPGAIFLDWKTHFLAQGFALNLAPVCDKTNAVRAFASLGIHDGDTVVLYDDYHHMFACRLWWAMRYWGFNNVFVLNGSWTYWQSRGYPVTRVCNTSGGGTFQPNAQPQLLTTLDEVLNRTTTRTLIDARSADGYNGTHDNNSSGHIPGAINLPFRDLMDSTTGLFKAEAELRQYFEQHISQLGNNAIISSCGSGYAGTATLVALKILGIDAPLYDGSFAEWRQDSSREIGSVRDRPADRAI